MNAAAPSPHATRFPRRARVRAAPLLLLVVASAAGACGGGRASARGGGDRGEHPTGPGAANTTRVQRGRPVARIGSGPGAEVVTDEEVAAAARAEGLTDPRAALERAVRVRLLAREARRRGLDERWPAVADTARRAAVQALLVDAVESRVRPDNVPTDVMAQGMALRAFDFAHGELYRTQHAVVRVRPDADAAARVRARAAAEQLRARVLALPLPRGGSAFEAAATEALRGLDHRVEQIPPCEAGGRMQRGALVPAYARAAAALATPGDVSPVVETPFGYHVIVLLEKIPPLVRSEAEVETLVREEAVRRLRRRALDELLTELRGQYGTHVRDEALRAVERAPLEAAP